MDSRRPKKKKSDPSKASKEVFDGKEIEEISFSSQKDLKRKLNALKGEKAKGVDIATPEEKKALVAEENKLKKQVIKAGLDHGQFSKEKATALHAYGRNIYKQGRFDEVEELSKEIVLIHEKIDGVEHLNTAMALGNVGAVSYRLKHYEDCNFAMERALYILLREYGEESKEILMHRAKMMTFQVPGAEHSLGLSYESYKDEL